MRECSTLSSLVIGYLFGCWLHPELFSVNFGLTDWHNIWTYAWIFLWPFMLAGHFILWVFSIPLVIIASFVFILLVALAILSSKG